MAPLTAPHGSPQASFLLCRAGSAFAKEKKPTGPSELPPGGLASFRTVSDDRPCVAWLVRTGHRRDASRSPTVTSLPPTRQVNPFCALHEGDSSESPKALPLRPSGQDSPRHTAAVAKPRTPTSASFGLTILDMGFSSVSHAGGIFAPVLSRGFPSASVWTRSVPCLCCAQGRRHAGHPRPGLERAKRPVKH